MEESITPIGVAVTTDRPFQIKINVPHSCGHEDLHAYFLYQPHTFSPVAEKNAASAGECVECNPTRHGPLEKEVRGPNMRGSL